MCFASSIRHRVLGYHRVLSCRRRSRQAFGARAKAGTTTITQRRLIADDGSHDIDVESSFPIVGGGTNAVLPFDQVFVERGRSESNMLIMEVASHPPAIALVNRLAQAAAKQMASR